MCFWKLLEACKGLSCYWVPGTVSPSFDAKDLAALQEEEEQETNGGLISLWPSSTYTMKLTNEALE